MEDLLLPSLNSEFVPSKRYQIPFRTSKFVIVAKSRREIQSYSQKKARMHRNIGDEEI